MEGFLRDLKISKIFFEELGEIVFLRYSYIVLEELEYHLL